MNNYLKFCLLPGLVVLCAGCMGVPMTNDVEKVIGKPFTNPPWPEKRWVTVEDSQGRKLTIIDPASQRRGGNFYKIFYNSDEPDYYKKQNEGVNTRYFINWGGTSELCVYSLLVGPDDIILSWRNEGKKHASDCRRP